MKRNHLLQASLAAAAIKCSADLRKWRGEGNPPYNTEVVNTRLCASSKKKEMEERPEECLVVCGFAYMLRPECFSDPCLVVGNRCHDMLNGSSGASMPLAPQSVSCEDYCCEWSGWRVAEISVLSVALLIILAVFVARLLRVRRRRVTQEEMKQRTTDSGIANVQSFKEGRIVF